MTIADEVIERFNAVFGEPKTTDPELFLAEFARCMDGYDADALRKAADRVIATNVFWPKPAELLAEARNVLAENVRHKPAEQQPFTMRARTPAELEAVEEIMRNFRSFMDGNTTGDRADNIDWKRGQRPGFEEMQRNSPNRAMHMTDYGLSQLSKRMTGEGSDA